MRERVSACVSVSVWVHAGACGYVGVCMVVRVCGLAGACGCMWVRVVTCGCVGLHTCECMHVACVRERETGRKFSRSANEALNLLHLRLGH